MVIRLIILCFVVFYAFSCKKNGCIDSREDQIFDKYLLLFYDSWDRNTARKKLHFPSFSKKDTVYLASDLFLTNNDILEEYIGGSGRIFPARTKIKLLTDSISSIEDLVKVRVLSKSDSGIYFTKYKALIFSLNGHADRRIMELVMRLNLERDNVLMMLSKEYEIEPIEVYEIINKKFMQKSGRPLIDAN